MTCLKRVEELVEELGMRAQQYRKAASKLAALIKKARKDLLSHDMHSAKEGIGQAIDMEQSTRGLEDYLHHAINEINEAERNLDEQYDSIFRQHCQSSHREWTVQGSSKQYLINDLIDVRVDFRQRVTLINRRRLRWVSPGRVIKAIAQENDRVWSGPLQGNAVLQTIWDAYREILESQSKAIGEYVLLKDIRAAIDRPLGRMDRVQFGAMLSRLFRSGSLETGDGWRLHLAPVRSPADSFPFSPQIGSGREGRGLLRFYRDEQQWR